MMETAGKEFSDLTVLALFASFERHLRDEISTKSSKLQEIIPNVLGDRINELAQKEIERWQIRVTFRPVPSRLTVPI